ncbi:MAG: squalene--hopene cyclase [Syntrophobacteraceae bacterium]|jgi:squalene-hopene/tetraprenyl-beta-curcumene cyclase|nr:squalene--hopene cyclase [Syntrophobacteraceae bacterium]
MIFVSGKRQLSADRLESEELEGTPCPDREDGVFQKELASPHTSKAWSYLTGLPPAHLRAVPPPGQDQRSLNGSARACMARGVEYFLGIQDPEGYWWAELESNTTITSEYIMLHTILGTLDPRRQAAMVSYLLGQQRDNGAWGLYHDDGGDLSTTVETYFALKLAGEDPRSEPMARARAFVLERGGIAASRVFTKIWLALFGQYKWKRIPSMPVEVVLLPDDFVFNIYEFSSWARGTIVPLSIVMALRPRLRLPRELQIPELHDGSDHGSCKRKPLSPTHRFFLLLDRFIKQYERRPIQVLRKRAIQAARDWVLDHQEESGDWAGIQPPMVYSILALHYLGYPLEHPAVARGLRAMEDFCLEDVQGLRMQSCISPVWDTALTALALLDCGVAPEHPALRKAAEWLIEKQVLTGGDWQVKNCCPPGGWAFEFVNSKYPDVDDSAVVLVALERLKSGVPGGKAEDALSRGLEWCLSMQCQNGGWAAFDKENTMMVLNRIPFADNEAMLDYPTADVSARVIEAMGTLGYAMDHPAGRRGMDFLRKLQEDDGSWWGRWGVNYIYGTWSVLRGLKAIGEDPGAPWTRAAVRWLKAHQNDDGGWGETCDSYRDPGLCGQGPSTASQTAWAVMGLLAAGEAESAEVKRGIEYLVRNQQPDGTWEEAHFTGTGFPNHFYIRYHNYRNCFPLMALGQYLRQVGTE